MNGPRGIRDPGLQAERTSLAWTRTALAMLVNALLALRAGWSHGNALVTALGSVLLIAAATTALCGVWRKRRLLGGHDQIAAPSIAIAGVGLVTLLACIAAMASVLLGR